MLLRLLIWCSFVLIAESVFAQPYAMTEYDRANLEQNLRWIIQRNRQTKTVQTQPVAHVAVFADAGVWHPGARSIVEALEQSDVPCVVIDKSCLNAESLKQFDVVVLPGGWAPLQWATAGEDGLQSLRRFVEEGGRCVGVCAGAYLVSKTVAYDDESFDYPLGLFDGVAFGPVPGHARFPEPGKASLRVTDAGTKRGLADLATHDAYYSGGPCFKEGTDVTVLAQYSDGSAAAISRPVGKGEVVLIGAHVERPIESSDTDPAPPWAGAILKALLGLSKEPVTR